METRMKILVATDGSKFSAQAVNYLVRHSGQFKDAEVDSKILGHGETIEETWANARMNCANDPVIA